MDLLPRICRRDCAGLRALGASLFFAGALLAPQAGASEDRQDRRDHEVQGGHATAPAPASLMSTRTGDARAATVQGPAITTRFSSFDGDRLSLQFRLAPAAARESAQEFGVSVAELDGLAAACNAHRDCDQTEFDRRTLQYYREHALRLSARAGEAPRLHVDVAQVVRRNRGRVQPVALELRRLARTQGRDREWMVQAAIALVQGGLVYRQPATWDGGRKILGFYPPPLALERGYGDCDTKAALLAAILQNLTDTPIVGIHVPRHYLLGIAGTPRPGQAAISYRGRQFLLVEAAGPATRRPGEIAEATQRALARNEGVRIDPMF